MVYQVAADVVVSVHFLFVLFVVAGGFLVLRWPRLLLPHLGAVLWAALLELGGWICPLTPLENWCRQAAGAAVYSGGFVERYLLPLLYPKALTRTLQIQLGVGVLLLNIGIYAFVLYRRGRRRSGPAPTPDATPKKGP